MVKLLITGSSGYVGYVLSRYFSEKKIDVIGLDISKNYAWNGNKNYKFYKCDITDRKKIKEVFQKEKPTHVIHLAYLMSPIHDKKREHDIDVNGSKHVLDISNDTKSVKQIILFSSASAYGAWKNNKLWIKEEQPLRPRDYRYGINKKKVEAYYNDFSRRKNLNLVIFRMCTALGASYHKKGGTVSLLANAIALPKMNNRFYELQYLHEDDLTNLVELVLNDKKVEGTFNLAPDSYSTIKDLVPEKFFFPVPLFLMRVLIGLLWKLRIGKVRPAAMTLITYGIIVDPSKLMKRYNYNFKYSTKEAFDATVDKRRKLGTL